MDQSWLYTTNNDTAIIVPTRSLANALNEQLAAHHLSQGKHVWEAPNIFVWQTFLQHLWNNNKYLCNDVITPISAQQSRLLWTRIIDQSKQQEASLNLLNVQQTVRSVARSWSLMNDWGIKAEQIANQQDADSQQFVQWITAYQDTLSQRQFIDHELLPQWLITQKCTVGFSKLIWHAFDVKTQIQRDFDDYASASSITIINNDSAQNNKPDQPTEYRCYQNPDIEIQHVLRQCREKLEQSDFSLRINVVIPDLQNRLAMVEQTARDIFYPGLSPLQQQNQATVYRLSLGQTLDKWPLINVAIRLISLLNNRIKVPELLSLLRNSSLGLVQENQPELIKLARYLNKQKIVSVRLEQLPALLSEAVQVNPETWPETGLHEKFAQLLDCFQALNKARQQNQYGTLTFEQWVNFFQQWLTCWGWPTAKPEALEYQLLQRWEKLLQDFIELSLIQPHIGISRSIELIKQMAREAVFSPKAPASPLLISGLYDAIGQPADICFLTGMSEHFPVPTSKDSFVPTQLLKQQAYPDADVQTRLQQSKAMLQSLIAYNQTTIVSYPCYSGDRDGLDLSVSSLFRERQFDDACINDVFGIQEDKPASKTNMLEVYSDESGLPWDSDLSVKGQSVKAQSVKAQRVKGGAKIFENQSNCPFKAYVTHQLHTEQDTDSEFGLDAMDHGIVIHALLQLAWDRLKTQKALLAMDDHQQTDFCERLVKEFVSANPVKLTEEKHQLLQLEQTRLADLLNQWLVQDSARPMAFSVTNTEDKGEANIAGIHFNYIIDRIDTLDDGRQLIVDYKTGDVSKSGWLGERPEQPQLPLYSLAWQAAGMSQKDSPSISISTYTSKVAGIAYAKVNSKECKYEHLAEPDIFGAKENTDWLDAHQQWPEIFTQLANDFLQGQAKVDPVKSATCNYCDLKPVCRIAQLRQQTGA